MCKQQIIGLCGAEIASVDPCLRFWMRTVSIFRIMWTSRGYSWRCSLSLPHHVSFFIHLGFFRQFSSRKNLNWGSGRSEPYVLMFPKSSWEQLAATSLLGCTNVTETTLQIQLWRCQEAARYRRASAGTNARSLFMFRCSSSLLRRGLNRKNLWKQRGLLIYTADLFNVEPDAAPFLP